MKKVIAFAVVVCLAMSNVSMSQPAKSQIFKKLMAEKLKSSQALLEGLALSDFKKLQDNAEDLLRISATEEWVAIKTPKYTVLSDEFRRAAEKIIQKSKAKNLDGAALGYVELTMTCVRCHEYVRDLKEAKLNGPGQNGSHFASSGKAHAFAFH
jgi:hypothetical protein